MAEVAADIDDSIKQKRFCVSLKKPNLNPNILSYCRQISNLNNISKLPEKLFLTRFLPHVKCLAILILDSPLFASFIHSMETTLVHRLDNIYHAADNGFAILLPSLDLTAAFDTIDHKILLNRLNSNFGISGSVHSWLSPYLADRSFNVANDSFTSSLFPLCVGCLQVPS